MEGFNGGTGRGAGGAVLFDLTAGYAVPDTTLMQTSEGVAVPEMLNGQCILLKLMHEGSNGRRAGKRGCTMLMQGSLPTYKGAPPFQCIYHIVRT